MTCTQEVIQLLKNMEGVIEVFPVNGETFETLRDIENNIKATLNMDVLNTGVEECLKRQNIFCIIKDSRFRPPPEPTVLLVGDDGLVMGKEIIPTDNEDYKENDEVIFLSEEFIIYKDVKPNDREYFLMPPVSFPELEEDHDIRNVVSCSPSAPGDLMLRKFHGLNDDPSLASILIGFDMKDNNSEN